MKAGLKVDASALMWWMDQDLEVLKSLSTNPSPLAKVLSNFEAWIDPGVNVWGNSPRFDCGILGDAYRAFDLALPWNFRLERDLRTLVSLAPEVKENHVFIGDKHNPVDDCLNQIDICHKIYRHLFI